MGHEISKCTITKPKSSSQHRNVSSMKSLALLFLVVAHVTAFHLKMGLSVGQTFPAAALKKWGVSGKPAVVYFYGADGSPSCTKECQAFGSTYEDFKALGCTVLGVRNEKVRILLFK
jgi:hypothetical protein